MQAFAESVFPGTEYAGISYEGDHPDIVMQMPDGGLDMQDHPVHWTLHCGRNECWPLRQLKDATPDQLAATASDEAYEAIGK